jgi:hypothetical protein
MQIYMTPETRQQLEALAKVNGESLSATVKLLIDEAYQVVVISTLPHPADAHPVPLVYVKPTAHDATGLIYTPLLKTTMHIDLERVRDDVHQEEEDQAARDAEKEQE